MSVSQIDVASLRHPTEHSRYILTLFVLIPLGFAIAAAVVASFGTILLLVPVALFFIWIIMRLFVAALLNSTVKVSSKSFPGIWQAIEEAKRKFGYTGNIDAYVYEDGSYNAAILPLLTHNIILLNSDVIAGQTTNDEIRFMVGRFVGALASKHYRFFWLEIYLYAIENLQMFNLFLYPYERAIKYSGDQLGLYMIGGDLETSVKALTKTVVGWEIASQVNIEAFLEQGIVSKRDFFSWLLRMLSTYPHMTHRVANLFRFGIEKFPAQSEAYISKLPPSTRAVIHIAISRYGRIDDLAVAEPASYPAISQIIFAAPSVILKGIPSNRGRYKLVLNFDELSRGDATIGRDRNHARYAIEDSSVSRLHATLGWKNGQLIVVDENSTNGTMVNGHRIRNGQAMSVSGGDSLAFGGVEFQVIV